MRAANNSIYTDSYQNLDIAEEQSHTAVSRNQYTLLRLAVLKRLSLMKATAAGIWVCLLWKSGLLLVLET